MCKRIFKFEFQLSSYWQNIKFSQYCPKISHFHKNRNFSSLFAPFLTNCFILISFMAGTCQEYSFSFLPVVSRWNDVTLETSLICILLLASRDVHFDKRMICFLSDLLWKAQQSQNHKEKHIISRTHRFYVFLKSSLFVILWYAFMNRWTV